MTEPAAIDDVATPSLTSGASQAVRPRRLTRRVLLPYAQAVGYVLAATAVAEALYRTTHSTRLSGVFLTGVLLTAFFVGSGPAYFAAGLAFMIYNFYLVEPRFTIEFTTPEDLLNLMVFLAVAMLTGNLTGRVKDAAARADARAKATSALFDATRDFSASSDETYIRQKLADHLASASRGAAFVRDGARMFASSGKDPTMSADLMAAASTVEREPAGAIATARHTDWSLRRLQVGSASLGVAGWRRSDKRSPTPDEEALVVIMSDAGAAAIARARLAADKAEAEARARTEELRNALLSSISHDLRTPLAAILASASSLQEFAEAFDAATRRDLASTIREEAERLDLFVANLLNMSRLEAGALTLQRVAFNVPEVVARTVERRTRGRTGRTIVSLEDGLPEAFGDPILFEQALGNVVENAARYAPDDTALKVSARRDAGVIAVEVADEGKGLAPEDLSRVFEKFYRAQASLEKGGTGLGLSITRGLLQAMGGTVAAANRPDSKGLIVTLSLPVTE